MRRNRIEMVWFALAFVLFTGFATVGAVLLAGGGDHRWIATATE